MRIIWKTLDLNNILQVSGVYAFKQGKECLYIGRYNNIAKRLYKRHIAFQIALNMPKITFLYHETKDYQRKELGLIKKLKLEWNGGASIYHKYPACDIPIDLKLSDEDLEEVISTLNF